MLSFYLWSIELNKKSDRRFGFNIDTQKSRMCNFKLDLYE